MPVLLILLLVAALFVTWMLLLPISIVQRYRYGKARRRVLPWVVRLNAWVLSISMLVFLASSWLASIWIPRALPDAVLGLGAGAVVGVVGAALHRIEVTPQGLFRTPNQWLVLGVSLLLAGRIALGLWLTWRDGPGTALAGWATHAGLIGVAGVLLGYSVATSWGLRFRVARVAKGFGKVSGGKTQDPGRR